MLLLQALSPCLARFHSCSLKLAVAGEGPGGAEGSGHEQRRRFWSRVGADLKIKCLRELLWWFSWSYILYECWLCGTVVGLNGFWGGSPLAQLLQALQLGTATMQSAWTTPGPATACTLHARAIHPAWMLLELRQSGMPTYMCNMCCCCCCCCKGLGGLLVAALEADARFGTAVGWLRGST